MKITMTGIIFPNKANPVKFFFFLLKFLFLIHAWQSCILPKLLDWIEAFGHGFSLTRFDFFFLYYLYSIFPNKMELSIICRIVESQRNVDFSPCKYRKIQLWLFNYFLTWWTPQPTTHHGYIQYIKEVGEHSEEFHGCV